MLGRMHPHAPPSGPRHGLGDDVEEVTTVYVGNLPPEVDEQSLLITFSYFGPIDTVQVWQLGGAPESQSVCARMLPLQRGSVCPRVLCTESLMCAFTSRTGLYVAC